MNHTMIISMLMVHFGARPPTASWITITGQNHARTKVRHAHNSS